MARFSEAPRSCGGFRGLTFRNDVEWLEDPPGLSFRGQGISYTETVFSAVGFSREGGLTLELALRIHESFGKRFQFIVELEAGDERSHLVLGQWKDEIIALQGDDYGYSGRKPRVACRVDPERAVLRLTALVGLLLSLLIETLQAWMTSRTSSLLDLTLNTVGTMVGALSSPRLCVPSLRRYHPLRTGTLLQ